MENRSDELLSFKTGEKGDEIRNSQRLGPERFFSNYSLEKIYVKSDEGPSDMQELQWDTKKRVTFQEFMQVFKEIESKALDLTRQQPDSPQVKRLREILANGTKMLVFPLLPQALHERIIEFAKNSGLDPDSLRISPNAVDKDGNPLPKHVALYGVPKPEEPSAKETNNS